MDLEVQGVAALQYVGPMARVWGQGVQYAEPMVLDERQMVPVPVPQGYDLQQQRRRHGLSLPLLQWWTHVHPT